MESKSSISHLSPEQKDIYEKPKFLHNFTSFIKNYLTFIVLFALLIDWQIHLILNSPHSNDILEMLIVLSLCASISEKLIQSFYYYILLGVVFAMIIIMHYLGFSTMLWILLFSILLGLKLNSIFKRKKISA
jgi:hypothetical protein